MKLGKIRTTGQLRTALADTAEAVLKGNLPIDKAMAFHKLAKNIAESLYSETKIAMFRADSKLPIEELGELKLGDPSEE